MSSHETFIPRSLGPDFTSVSMYSSRE